MTVAELGDRMASSEVTAWAAYERVTGPLGPERGDIQAAMTAFYIVRALGSDVSLVDLLPDWDRRPVTWQQQRDQLVAFAAAHADS